MGIGGDERGVTVQIGAVILFGFLVVGLSVYQASVVPAQNKEVEFNHNQRVQSDLVNLRGAVADAASRGDAESVTLELGTRYPSRALFINPAPPSGTARSVGTDDPAVNVTVANATAAPGTLTDDVGDYWNGTSRSFGTGVVAYAPSYNRYGSAPVTVYENGVVHSEQRGATVPATDERLLNGKDITLVTVDGNLSASGVAGETVDVEPTSVATNVVRLRNDTSNVTVTVPTRLSESAWRDLLAEELDDGHLLGVGYADGPGELSLLTLRLESNTTYRLRMAKVAVGSGATEPEPTYLVKDRGDGVTVAENTAQTLTVEVRDEYDNPAGIGRVNVTLDGQGSLNASGDADLTNVSVGDDGTVELDYEAPADVDGTETARVNVSLGNASTVDADAPTETQFDVEVSDVDGSGGGGGGAGNVGSSGVSDYNETQNQTISTEGGIWTNITDANAIRLENPRFSPINPKQGGLKQQNRYFRLAFVLNNSTTKYTFVVGGDQQGLVYKQKKDSRELNNRKVSLLKYQQGNGTKPEYLFEGEPLTKQAANDWLEGNLLKLLDIDSYNNPGEVDSGIEGVRSTVQNANDTDTVQAFITDTHGRTGMKIAETNGKQLSFVSGTADDPNGRNNGARLRLTNDGDTAATVTAIRVNTSAAARIANDGASSPWDAEVTINASDDGERAGVVDLGTRVDLNDTARVDPGDDAVFRLFEFQDSSNSGVSVEGKTITVRLYFDDGSTRTIRFSG